MVALLQCNQVGVWIRADATEEDICRLCWRGFHGVQWCYVSVANKRHTSPSVKLALASMARKNQPANIVGKEIQKQRYALGLTQEQFAAQCQLHGLDISRATVSQIEAQIRCVSDLELLQLSSVLGVSADSLLSTVRKAKSKSGK